VSSLGGGRKGVIEWVMGEEEAKMKIQLECIYSQVLGAFTFCTAKYVTRRKGG
jgi:phage tail tube protein FII